MLSKEVIVCLMRVAPRVAVGVFHKGGQLGESVVVASEENVCGSEECFIGAGETIFFCEVFHNLRAEGFALKACKGKAVSANKFFKTVALW